VRSDRLTACPVTSSLANEGGSVHASEGDVAGQRFFGKRRTLPRVVVFCDVDGVVNRLSGRPDVPALEVAPGLSYPIDIDHGAVAALDRVVQREGVAL